MLNGLNLLMQSGNLQKNKVSKNQLLRSSLFYRLTKIKGESWKARAAEPKGSVQAQAVGITTLGAERVVADKAQTYCPRLEGLVPWSFEEPRLY